MWEEHNMWERNRLEEKIVTELRELKGLECQLDRKFARLSAASPKIRASFLQSVMDLEDKATGIDRLIDVLAGDAHPAIPATA
jgi:hypothetical protein